MSGGMEEGWQYRTYHYHHDFDVAISRIFPLLSHDDDVCTGWLMDGSAERKNETAERRESRAE